MDDYNGRHQDQPAEGINAMVRLDRATNETVIVLSNYDSPTARDLVPQIVAMLRSRS